MQKEDLSMTLTAAAKKLEMRTMTCASNMGCINTNIGLCMKQQQIYLLSIALPLLLTMQQPTFKTLLPTTYSEAKERLSSVCLSKPVSAAAEEEARAVGDNSTLLLTMMPVVETPASMLPVTCDMRRVQCDVFVCSRL
jgi:hypothetical protein